jgi:hypothetical protein
MSNAFYYFFSAVPQVMASVLGLFGVLIIFKIQHLSKGLSKVVEILYNEIESKEIFIRVKDEVFLGSIESALNKNDIKELTNLFKDSVSEEIINFSFESYKNIKKIRKYLVKATIIDSILTVILIVTCLSIIPLADIFIMSDRLLITLYGGIILFTIACFIGFINILQNAFTPFTL